MANQSKFEINTKEVIGDINQYSRDTKIAFKRTLREYALNIESTQIRTLRSRVKVWTGRLGSSISIEPKGDYTFLIGPDSRRVIYAWWIETGRRGGKQTAFSGYEYVGTSVKRWTMPFTNALKRDIQNSAKK